MHQDLGDDAAFEMLDRLSVGLDAEFTQRKRRTVQRCNRRPTTQCAEKHHHPNHEVNFDRQKLYGWEDQPLLADDIFFGGEGADTFLFNPQINAKRDIILEHVNDDRTIDWAGVAGENGALHAHWVDLFGIDIIADYRIDEGDVIAIVGHTATPEVTYKLIDTDNDGVDDEVISIISVYSDQGANGGAHDGDYLGQIVVYGDMVNPEALVREAGVTHGIVKTVDDLPEALAPSGAPKVSLIDGVEVLGYDTRGLDGSLGAIVESPERFSGNPFASTVTFATNLPSTVPAPVAVIDALSHSILESMTFTGNPNDAPSTDATPGAFANIAHQGRAAGLAQTTGTIAFTFTPDSPGNGWQAMFSKEARNYVDGGHLSAWISNGGDLKVRYQSTDETVYLIDHHIELNPGQAHHFAFTFDGTSASLYIDGERRDAEDLSENPSFLLGMSGNTESLVFGASTTTRDTGELNHLNDFFDGTIENVVFVDRALAPVEVFKLAHGALEITPSVPTAAPLDITGTANPDTLNGDTGNDWIRGLGGNDILTGHAGNDAIYGGLDDDVIHVGAGDDTVFGGSGNNGIDGGTGDDTLYGGSDADRIDGGADNGTVYGGSGNDDLAGGAGNDAIYGGLDDDVIHAGAGDDTVFGGSGNDGIDGGTGSDVIHGGEGDDVVRSGTGNDTLRGGDGADTLIAESGLNEVAGGLDADVFRFESLTEPRGLTIIRDYRAGEDSIHIADDLLVDIDDAVGFTRLTLTNADGSLSGAIAVFGSDIENTDDIVRFDAQSDTLI